jgi:DNA-binding CsgD family transcriptional regulator
VPMGYALGKQPFRLQRLSGMIIMRGLSRFATMAKRRVPLPPQIIALLGKRADREMAQRLHISKYHVAKKRRELGIVSLSESRVHRWTRKEIALLGTLPDTRLATQLGISAIQVRTMRLKQKVRRYTNQAFWSRTRIAMLGTAPDKEIAKRLKITTSTVSWRRQQLGIPSFTKSFWTKARLKLLGRASDKVVARKLGNSNQTVMHKRNELRIPPAHPQPIWNENELRLFDKYSDEEIARRVGVALKTVKSKRDRLRAKGEALRRVVRPALAPTHRPHSPEPQPVERLELIVELNGDETWSWVIANGNDAVYAGNRRYGSRDAALKCGQEFLNTWKRLMDSRSEISSDADATV